MKKLMLMALLMYCTSCASPEDKATGDADSTNFNQSGNNKNLNTATDEPGNQSHANNNDTSASPATSKQNSNSGKEGAHRSYVPGGAKDSTHKK
jgi:hypothetical protein